MPLLVYTVLCFNPVSILGSASLTSDAFLSGKRRQEYDASSARLKGIAFLVVHGFQYPPPPHIAIAFLLSGPKVLSLEEVGSLGGPACYQNPPLLGLLELWRS